MGKSAVPGASLCCLDTGLRGFGRVHQEQLAGAKPKEGRTADWKIHTALVQEDGRVLAVTGTQSFRGAPAGCQRGLRASDVGEQDERVFPSLLAQDIISRLPAQAPLHSMVL